MIKLLLALITYGLLAFYVALYICAVDYAFEDIRKRFRRAALNPTSEKNNG